MATLSGVSLHKPSLSIGAVLPVQKRSTDSAAVQKTQGVFARSRPTGGSSDDELPPLDRSVRIFTREIPTRVEAMTIPCKDGEGNRKNIKGSTLIEIVHNVVQELHAEITDLATQHERDIGGTIIPPLRVMAGGIVRIDGPVDWLMSLGGWKGMAPAAEIRDCFPFFDRSKKFTGAKIFDNELTFLIANHRVHIPKGFSIGGFDVTTSWKKIGREWVRGGSKTDLSYSQITKAIAHIKTAFGLSDASIAAIQLSALGRRLEVPQHLWKATPAENRIQIQQFLDYLNALMFGIEPSGLNAALATSLMTLDLIFAGKMRYDTAFKANEDGGIYPYACFSGNGGTYNQRERILFHAREQHAPLSMREFRDNPALSPVAVKEASIIKTWLANRIDLSNPYDEQLNRITQAVKDLFAHYFCWGSGDEMLNNFSPTNQPDDRKE